jgi:hypothetical protein
MQSDTLRKRQIGLDRLCVIAQESLLMKQQHEVSFHVEHKVILHWRMNK